MSNYADDCTMDAKSGLAYALWSTIRLLFVSDDPTDVQRIVGLTRAEITVVAEQHVLHDLFRLFR